MRLANSTRSTVRLGQSRRRQCSAVQRPVSRGPPRAAPGRLAAGAKEPNQEPREPHRRGSLRREPHRRASQHRESRQRGLRQRGPHPRTMAIGYGSPGRLATRQRPRPLEARRHQLRQSTSGPGSRRLSPAARLVPRPVSHRPAALHRAVHRHMPGRTAAGGGPRGRAVAQHPGHDDQARPPLVPIAAALRVAPPCGSPHRHLGN
jgi:hypothetical protein